MNFIEETKDFKFWNVELGCQFCSFLRKSHLYEIRMYLEEEIFYVTDVISTLYVKLAVRQIWVSWSSTCCGGRTSCSKKTDQQNLKIRRDLHCSNGCFDICVNNLTSLKKKKEAGKKQNKSDLIWNKAKDTWVLRRPRALQRKFKGHLDL